MKHLPIFNFEHRAQPKLDENLKYWLPGINLALDCPTALQLFFMRILGELIILLRPYIV
jgi:hypothetical protein